MKGSFCLVKSFLITLFGIAAFVSVARPLKAENIQNMNEWFKGSWDDIDPILYCTGVINQFCFDWYRFHNSCKVLWICKVLSLAWIYISFSATNGFPSTVLMKTSIRLDHAADKSTSLLKMFSFRYIECRQSGYNCTTGLSLRKLSRKWCRVPKRFGIKVWKASFPSTD